VGHGAERLRHPALSSIRGAVEPRRGVPGRPVLLPKRLLWALGAHLPSVFVPPWTAFFYFGTIALAFAVIACGRRSSGLSKGSPVARICRVRADRIAGDPAQRQSRSHLPVHLVDPISGSHSSRSLSEQSWPHTGSTASIGMSSTGADGRSAFSSPCNGSSLQRSALAVCFLLVLKKEALAERYIPLYDNSVRYLRPALAYPFVALVAIRAAGLWLTLSTVTRCRISVQSMRHLPTDRSWIRPRALWERWPSCTTGSRRWVESPGRLPA